MISKVKSYSSSHNLHKVVNVLLSLALGGYCIRKASFLSCQLQNPTKVYLKWQIQYISDYQRQDNISGVYSNVLSDRRYRCHTHYIADAQLETTISAQLTGSFALWFWVIEIQVALKSLLIYRFFCPVVLFFCPAKSTMMQAITGSFALWFWVIEIQVALKSLLVVGKKTKNQPCNSKVN